MVINGVIQMNIDTYKWEPVSIVISNFNYGCFLESAIYSACIQKKSSVIIVDDCSSDNSWQLIKKNIKKYNYIGIKLKENSKGNARGKNIGISLSKSDFITCLDSDDMLLPDSITNRLSVLLEKEVDFVHGKAVRMHSNDFAINIYNKVGCYKNHSDTYNDIYNKTINNILIRKLPENNLNWYLGIEASTVLCKKSIYKSVGLYNEDLKWKIDREMWYRILLAGNFKKKFIDEHVSVYRSHSFQATKQKDIKNPLEINKKFKNILNQLENKQYSPKKIQSYNPYDFISDIIL